MQVPDSLSDGENDGFQDRCSCQTAFRGGSDSRHQRY